VKYFGSVREYELRMLTWINDETSPLVREMIDYPGEVDRSRMHIPWYWNFKEGDWLTMSSESWISQLEQIERFQTIDEKFFEYEGSEESEEREEV